METVKELSYNGVAYTVEAKSFFEVTEEERNRYNLKEDDQLIHLVENGKESRIFPITLDDNCSWHSTSTDVVDEELVYKIGCLIESCG